ncbi:SSrecog-domain-containing protein [Flagelloscypha sp. PMI_526]|nr:SSrecog-domain-containing protein [Flagelloscypha sp. PMI_526]
MSAATQFDQIYINNEVGKVRIASSGMAWKGNDADKMVTMPGPDIKWAQWLRVAKGFQLRLGMSNHRREKLDGFDRDDHDKVSSLLKNHFSVTLETKDVSFRGWNWGQTDFQGQELAFVVADRTAFELPLEKVSNSNIAGRTEVSLEFATSNSKSGSREDEMVEIRFFVPGTQTKTNSGSDAGDNQQDEDEEISAAQVFHDQIQEKADIGEVTGDIILSFEEVPVVYSTISRLFLLPKDEQSIMFILALNSPIRQGQTRYHYLVMAFSVDEEITAELNITEEQEKNYGLERKYEVPTYQLISTIFRALVGKKITQPGSYKNRDGNPNVKAHMKAVQGDLFMLDKHIFFVTKSPTLIAFADIHSISFSRVGSTGTSQRTFDMAVTTRDGPEHVFSTISKDEQDNLQKYFEDKKVRVKVAPTEEEELEALGVDDDDDDEDMASVDSSDSGPPRRKGGDDDDESSEDEDFQASSSDEGSPSESDSDSDGAATASDASGDRDMVKKKKKNKDKDGSPKKKKKKAAEGDDMDVDGAKKPKKKKVKKDDNAMDVDGDDDKPKPKPKPKPKASTSKEDPDEPPKKKMKKADD